MVRLGMVFVFKYISVIHTILRNCIENCCKYEAIVPWLLRKKLRQRHKKVDNEISRSLIRKSQNVFLLTFRCETTRKLKFSNDDKLKS